MPRGRPKGTAQATIIMPHKQENGAEIKVQRLAILLDECCEEGILDNKILAGAGNDCLYCPVRTLCDKVWDGCTEYGKSLGYDDAKVRLEAVFAQKHKFAGGNGNKLGDLTRFTQSKRDKILQVNKLQQEAHLTQKQIAEQIGIPRRAVNRYVAIIKSNEEV